MANFSNTFTPNPNQKPGLLSSSLNPSTATQTSTPQTNGLMWGNVKPPAPQASTPVKSHSVGADGSTKTEYHTPATPTAPETGQKPQVLNASETNSVPPIQAPANQPIPQAHPQQTGATVAPNNPILGAAYDQATYAPNLRQNLSNSELALSRKGIALPFLTGQQQAMEQTYGNEIAGQGQKAAALGNLAGYGAPQSYSLYSQPYNPLTDTYGGGGTGGAINRSVTASNIGSAGDFQSKIQSTQAQKSAADANFNILNSYASQAGLNETSPILAGLQQKYGQTAGGAEAPAVAGFKAQLQTLRAAYGALTGGDPTVAIPDAITPSQLKQVQQALADTVQNNITGYQNQLSQLQNGGAQGGGGSDYQAYLKAIGQ